MKRLKDTFRIIAEIIFEDGKSFFAPLLTVLTGIILYFIVSRFLFKTDLLTEKTENIKIILLVLVTAISILPILIKFLYTDREKKTFDEVITYTRFREELQREKLINEQLQKAFTKNPEILNIENSVYEKVLDKLELSLLNKLDEKFKKNLEKEFIINTNNSELLPLTKNTEKYIDRIQGNSIVNLLIGIIGTITSISILAFAILSDKAFNDIGTFLMHFLPRITFVIFIHLFAFFFLRLYKNNLEDAKYFQNELTNLSAKSAALRIAYLTSKDSNFSEIIKDLATTERNFKLLKEETMLNIEKAKIEKDFDLETINAFKDFMKAYKKE